MFSLSYIWVGTLLFLLSPTITRGATAQQGLQEAVSGTGLPQTPIEATAANLIIVILGIVGILFMLLILYGGYSWMMGSRSGNEKDIAQAKTILTNATIGLIIITLAYAITYFIASQLISATSNTTPTTTTQPTP